jgi:hypothetical protein
MPTILATIVSSKEPGSLQFSDWGKTRVTSEIENSLASLEGGINTGSLDVQLNPAYAAGVLALSAGAGAVGGTIGGRLVTAAWATSDAASCDAIAAAILADATASKFVTARSRAASGTVTIAGGSGVITVTLNAPGIPPQTFTTAWATSDTATAAALVALINAAPNLPVVARNAAGVITIYATTAGTGATNTAGNSILLAATGTGVTVSGALLAGGGTNANVLVLALMPGTVGLGITLVASGTGVTAPTGANLVAGIGAPGNSYAC